MGTERLRVLVAVHVGQISGVNTYAEHVAAAAAAAGAEVTLLTAFDDDVAEMARRLVAPPVRVLSLGMRPPELWRARLARLSPGYAAHSLSAAVARNLRLLGDSYDAVHLNYPHLAATMPRLGRLCVAAWFHPHSIAGRAVSTWRHTGRRVPRSLAFALKGMLHYRNDALGYRAADVVVAPTAELTRELLDSGINAVHCFPPAHIVGDDRGVTEPRTAHLGVRLLVCAGDLSQPRKNVGLAIEAVDIFARRGTDVELELIGRKSGRLATSLKRLPRNVRLIVSGPLALEQVHARMRIADALLLPSLFEEWGYVAIEAALQGTPSITLPVYPFSEIPFPLGFRSPGQSAREYADTIFAVLDDLPPRSQVSQRARERYGIETVGRQLLRIWSGESPGAAEIE